MMATEKREQEYHHHRRRRHHNNFKDLQKSFVRIIVVLLFLTIAYLCVILVSFSPPPPPPTTGTSTTPTLSSTSKKYQHDNNQKTNPHLSSVFKNPSLYLNDHAVASSSSPFPPRLMALLRNKTIVGDYLGDIKTGSKTVDDAIRESQKETTKQEKNNKQHPSRLGEPSDDDSSSSSTTPMTISEITSFLTTFLDQLHSSLSTQKDPSPISIWSTYHDLVRRTLHPWDRDYLQRMPSRHPSSKNDNPNNDTIFISLASYRDEMCLSTLTNIYAKSRFPERVYVGLVQQNCEGGGCRSGVLEGGKMEDAPPDDNCHHLFCTSPEGSPHCTTDRVHLLAIPESHALGPYAARYFASKLWNGQHWYVQIDSHTTFVEGWDVEAVKMMRLAPSDRPVVSHYPPPHYTDLEGKKDKPAPRLCGPVFADSDLESQIVRLEGLADYDTKKMKHPRFAPFVAAGFFIAHSDFLRDVPYDPFLPWIFMGEELIMSSRLWTHGYDIFSPTISIVGHVYVRRHKPKFWESIHRTLGYGLHNPLQQLVLQRIKYQLNYPESARDMVKPQSLLTALDGEEYGMGRERRVEDYLTMVGLDVMRKEVFYTKWCELGIPPVGFERFNELYQ